MLVTVEDGVATRIQGDPSMPFTDGTLCTKVAYYLERTYSPDRLLYPMRRAGPKGKGQFERITWDEALDEIAARLKALAAENADFFTDALEGETNLLELINAELERRVEERTAELTRANAELERRVSTAVASPVDRVHDQGSD